MKYTSISFVISIAVLLLYTLYILAVKGIAGLLLSSAVGLITAYYVDEFEIIVASTVLFGLIYVFIMNVLPRCLTTEGFEQTTPPGLKGPNTCPGNINASTPKPEGGQQIIDRIAEMSGRHNIPTVVSVTRPLKPQPKPVYSTRGVEGFADAEVVGESEKKADQEEEGKAVPEEEAEVAESQPATPMTGGTPITSGGKKKEGLLIGGSGRGGTGGAGGSLFKLGEMPSESASGPYVDVGTTLMKAMDSLKPEQVNAMTAETKQLVETQKSLIQMLQSMKPVLQDGRQLLDTFTGIFGKGNGAQNGTLVGDYKPGVRQ
jgi:hypothetical protein